MDAHGQLRINAGDLGPIVLPVDGRTWKVIPKTIIGNSVHSTEGVKLLWKYLTIKSEDGIVLPIVFGEPRVAGRRVRDIIFPAPWRDSIVCACAYICVAITATARVLACLPVNHARTQAVASCPPTARCQDEVKHLSRCTYRCDRPCAHRACLKVCQACRSFWWRMHSHLGWRLFPGLVRPT
jgi:hypothetical protein